MNLYEVGNIIFDEHGNNVAIVNFNQKTAIALFLAAPEMYQILRLFRNKFADELGTIHKEEIDLLLAKIEGA